MRFRYVWNYDLEDTEELAKDMEQGDTIFVEDTKTGIVYQGEVGYDLIADCVRLASYGILPNA